jgi:hypothetical protein
MCDQAKGAAKAPSFVLSKQTLQETNQQEIRKLWGSHIEVRDCKPDFGKRPLGQYLKGLEARIDKLEKQAGFVKGFELEVQRQRRRVPQPKAGDVWYPLKKEKERWTVYQVRNGLVALQNGGYLKTITAKSLRKHYRPVGWEG